MNITIGRLRFTAGFEPEILGPTRLGSLLSVTHNVQPKLFDYTANSVWDAEPFSVHYGDRDDDNFEDETEF